MSRDLLFSIGVIVFAITLVAVLLFGYTQFAAAADRDANDAPIQP